MPLFPPQDYRKTEFTHRIGLAAARPAATDVLPGTLYFSTDTLILERSDGTAWSTYSPSGTPGAQGVPGPPGIQGEQGEDGEYFLIPGPIGNTGATGATGSQGPAGVAGPQGLDGEDGEPSYIPGPQGVPGNTGATGAQGIQGPIGPPGLDAEEPEYPYIIPGERGAAGSAAAGGVTGTYLQSSFTVATGNWRMHGKRLEMTGSNRATLQGTARLSIYN